ncbi:MAG: CDP-diacylglycerol--glycerol-3-phosphate 3-phosphatidyltransferase [Bacilli bacterium]
MNLPNKITTFRMVMVIVLILLLTICGALNFTGPYLWGDEETGVSLIRFIAFILFVVASVSDFLDGYLARKLNLVTTYGKFMDPIADKLLVDSLLIFYALPINQAGFGFVGKTGIPLVFVVIMIARDLVVDAVRMIAMEKNIVIAASWFGKTKTVLQMVAISLVLLNNWPFVYLGWSVNVTNIICGLAGLVSLASGIDYLVKSRELFAGDK